MGKKRTWKWKTSSHFPTLQSTVAPSSLHRVHSSCLPLALALYSPRICPNASMGFSYTYNITEGGCGC